MDPIEVLLEYFDEEDVAFILEYLDEDEIMEIVEALMEEAPEEGDSDSEYAIKLLKSINESIEKIEKTLNQAKLMLDYGSRIWPPFLNKKEAEARKQAKAIIKLKSKDFRELKKHIKVGEVLAEFSRQQAKIVKKQKDLKELLRDIEIKLKQCWSKFWNKVISAIGVPGIIVILVVVLLLFIVIGISALFSSEDEVKKNGMTSAFGINNTDFYGARLIYEDKEQENIEMVKNFAGILADSVTAVETEYDAVDITINVDENTDYLTVESNPETSPVINILTGIATKVYEIDNPGVGIPATLTDIVSGIKYFGVNQDMHDVVSEAIYKYINDNDMYQKAGEDELPEDVETKIQTTVTTEVAKNVVRTEKLFVEDQIFKTDSDVLTVKTARNYKAMIFMPNKDVNFSCISLKTYGINKDDFKVYIQNGENKIELDTTYTPEINQYSHETSSDISISASKFVAIDETNPLNGALSLVPSLENYLETAKDAEGNEIAGVYTYSKAGVVVEFESSVPFVFAELRTEWD